MADAPGGSTPLAERWGGTGARVSVARVAAAGVAASAAAFSTSASAATPYTLAPMPWEGVLQVIADSLSGPVARVAGVLAVIALGAILAIGGPVESTKRCLQVLLGASILATAVSFGLPLLGFSLSL